MKLCIGDTPITAMNVVNYDVNTDDATVTAASMQAGVTAYARGTKITGTGKAFRFASYGKIATNTMTPIPGNINVIEIGCVSHPFQTSLDFDDIISLDFSTKQVMGNVLIDNVQYPITVSTEDNQLQIICAKNIDVQVFYGKDEYV